MAYLRVTIEFIMEVQDPCEMDDGEEYADFCIGQGLSLFYDDEENERDDEGEDNGRNNITDLMFDEYYDKLVLFWDEHSEKC